MKKIFFLFAALSFFPVLHAQTGSDYYRSASNPYYWKNRPPFPGYWQQDVAYKIKAVLDDKTDIIDGSEELDYWNNSPDTLTFVYFHLYQNAFQPGSYCDDLYRNNNYDVKYGKYEAQKKDIEVNTIRVDGQEVKTELDNTILKVWLPKPMLPNTQITFAITFKSYFDDGGTIRRRMKMYKTFGYKHYDGVHWYPRISVYDRKQGWDTDQHLDKEFYGDFGSYDVDLTLPNNYILEGTGVMMNEQEVLPPDLRQKLDISNFAKKPWGSTPSVIIQPDGTTKTWKFHADNVHDFAFTADPLYRIGEADWNGVRCIAMAQEQHCIGWQDAAGFTAKVIETYSHDWGSYAYPKMVVCDAQDGMEYPMLTLDGGFAPNYYSLLAHEVGHNWFFGMVGSNETYRALLDEGFTQFIGTQAYRKILGEYRRAYPPANNIFGRYTAANHDPDKIINSEVYTRYMYDAVRGDETVIDTHSSGFNGATGHGGGYNEVYFKTATMLYNLQYVLGDTLFQHAMQHYFNQWKICHPYVEDFRNSIIQYTHVDLNWFFDEWLTTSKTLDYGVKCVKKARHDSVADTYLVKFKRYGRMHEPIDFTVISKDGTHYDYYIPNTWFVKQTTATVLPKWYGWDKIRPTYTAKIVVPNGISNVVIDTTNRLADMNMTNNKLHTSLEDIVRFDSKIYNPPAWEHYTIRARPDIWYNGYDGVKGGMYLGGDYMGLTKKFDLLFDFNTGAAQSQLPPKTSINKFDRFSVDFGYSTSLGKMVKNASVYFDARHLDGLDAVKGGFEIYDRNMKNKFFIQYKMMYRADSADLVYLLYPAEWQIKKFNNTITFGFEHPFNYHHGNGYVQLQLHSSSIGSDYDYHFFSANVVNRCQAGPLNFNTRIFGQIGTGKNWANESMLYAAGASPEELMDNKYTRSIGFFPTDWATYGDGINHFQAGGGLNLRGYAGYYMPQFDWYGDVRNTYKGTTGYALNEEMEFQKLFAFIGKKMPKVNSVIGITTYFFGDVGAINFNTPGEPLAMADFRADAGAGCTLTIKRFPPLQTVKPLTIRFDVPFFINSAPYNSPNYVAMRWIIGINRAF